MKLLTLLKKDWRVNRPAVIATAVLLPLVYAGVALSLARAERAPMAGIGSNVAFFAMMMLALSAAGSGGVAFAAERRERSADFVAMLPVTRGMILLSKLLVPIVILGGLWLVHVAILLLALSIDPQEHIKAYFEPLMIFSAAIVMMLGVAWLLSSFLSSPAISASVAIGVTIISFLLIAHFGEEMEHRDHQTLVLLNVALPAAAGVGGLVAGSVYYLWRVAP